MCTEERIEKWKAEEEIAHIHGWDFSHIEGKTMEEAMAEVKMVVEGVYSAKAAMQLAEKYNVQLPIIEQVNLVLYTLLLPFHLLQAHYSIMKKQ